jgi:hypothetical protein
MTFPPIGALQGQTIPMTAAAASKTAARRPTARAGQAPCKSRASYLKPKEIQEDAQVRTIGRFDLRHPPNYLKVLALP